MPIIFLSADITEDAFVKGIDAGGNDYLPKPITQRVLSAKFPAMARIADMRKELEAASADLEDFHQSMVKPNCITDVTLMKH